MVGTKVYSEVWGWGEVFAEYENSVVVRFDADPWVLRDILKKDLS